MTRIVFDDGALMWESCTPYQRLQWMKNAGVNFEVRNRECYKTWVLLNGAVRDKLRNASGQVSTQQQ